MSRFKICHVYALKTEFYSQIYLLLPPVIQPTEMENFDFKDSLPQALMYLPKCTVLY